MKLERTYLRRDLNASGEYPGCFLLGASADAPVRWHEKHGMAVHLVRHKVDQVLTHSRFQDKYEKEIMPVQFLDHVFPASNSRSLRMLKTSSKTGSFRVSLICRRGMFFILIKVILLSDENDLNT